MGATTNKRAPTKVWTNTGILTAAGTALAANNDRLDGYIQNLGTNPLFVKFGAAASTADFTFVLAAGLVDNDGSSPPEPIGLYRGLVTVAGTAPRFVAAQGT